MRISGSITSAFVPPTLQHFHCLLANVRKDAVFNVCGGYSVSNGVEGIWDIEYVSSCVSVCVFWWCVDV